MYFVVKCPNCGKLQIFKPIKNIWKKRCVYCGYTFTVNPKSKHSSSIILFYSENIKEAQEFLKKNQV